MLETTGLISHSKDLDDLVNQGLNVNVCKSINTDVGFRILLQCVSTVAQNGQTHLQTTLLQVLTLLVGSNPSHFN